MKKMALGRNLVLAIAVGVAPGMAAANTCSAIADDVLSRLEKLADSAGKTEKTVKDDHAKTTSSDYSKDYFKKFEDLNKNAKEASQLVNKAFDIAGYTKPLSLGKWQDKMPPEVTITMNNAVELAQAALDEEKTKLDVAELRCGQNTEDAALGAYLDQASDSLVSQYKTTKKSACKIVHILADLQDKREKLNDFRKNGYPLFFLHVSDKKGFAGKERTVQLKVDLRMYPEYPSKPVNSTKLNGQPILLGTLEGIDLSYNSWFKFSDNNWTSLNLFQYIVDDTDQGEVCPTKIKVSGSVQAKLCVSVEDIEVDKIRVKVRGKFNYNNDWKAVSLGTHTIPAPFGYLADLSDMKEKKMQDLKKRLTDRLASLLGEHAEIIRKAQEWKEACS